jgi:hypothetical protein
MRRTEEGEGAPFQLCLSGAFLLMAARYSSGKHPRICGVLLCVEMRSQFDLVRVSAPSAKLQWAKFHIIFSIFAGQGAPVRSYALATCVHKDAGREESIMSDQHNKPRPVRIREAEERQLQALLRQHEEIGDRIIALVYKTSAETEQLVRTMRQKKPGDLVAFPNPAGPTQKPAWNNVLSRIMRKGKDS